MQSRVGHSPRRPIVLTVTVFCRAAAKGYSVRTWALHVALLCGGANSATQRGEMAIRASHICAIITVDPNARSTQLSLGGKVR